MNGGIISALPQLDVMRASYLCPNCGLPRDYEHFDESGFAETPSRGREVLLARVRIAAAILWVARKFLPVYRPARARSRPGRDARPAMDHLG